MHSNRFATGYWGGSAPRAWELRRCTPHLYPEGIADRVTEVHVERCEARTVGIADRVTEVHVKRCEAHTVGIASLMHRAASFKSKI